MQVNKNYLEQLLLNQSDKELCERQLKMYKEKYELLRKTWQQYTMSAKKGYEEYKKMEQNIKNMEKELEEKNKNVQRISNKLNAFEKKVSRGMRSSRGKHSKRYSPK
ncbi:MAG: hypothetical protein CL842_05530 [Crocinitomicaceae bacterium]|nr:hypothetical protein [Crocinitomicaceae bacterium]|tara:strand:- start:2787 stop:3107 length:321 start_codon:yes stop_codon:yes gene_type:complete